MGLYPSGGYPRNTEYTCSVYNPILGAECIIDNDHPGRNHWGARGDGTFVEWPHTPNLVTVK